MRSEIWVFEKVETREQEEKTDARLRLKGTVKESYRNREGLSKRGGSIDGDLADGDEEEAEERGEVRGCSKFVERAGTGRGGGLYRRRDRVRAVEGRKTHVGRRRRELAVWRKTWQRSERRKRTLLSRPNPTRFLVYIEMLDVFDFALATLPCCPLRRATHLLVPSNRRRLTSCNNSRASPLPVHPSLRSRSCRRCSPSRPRLEEVGEGEGG
jgi:hypothetical protein